ncbi:MAG: SH3 domain-containing protein [Candidatus Limnocylindria bacterium]
MLRALRFGRLTAGMAILLALAGCGEAQPSGSTASAPPETQTGASPAASATPAATAAPSAEGAAMIVVADGLRLRAEPGTEAALVGTLARGTVVRTTDGPIEAGGFRWYEVVDTMDRLGWAAEGDGTDPWLSPIESIGDARPLLAFQYGCDVTGPFNAPSTIVFDDGRVVLRESRSGSYVVRRLSPAGVAHVGDNVLGSPYLQHSAEYPPVLLPGAEPPGHGACSFTFTTGTDAEPVVITSTGWFGDQEESAFYEPSPERKALDAIARNLMAIDSVLGASMWESPGWLPFIAEDYMLWLEPGVGPVWEGAPLIDPATLTLGDLDTFGDPTGTGRCGPLSREGAFELARALNRAEVPDEVRLNVATFSAYQTDEAWTTLTLVPRTPAYDLGCDDFGV